MKFKAAHLTFGRPLLKLLSIIKMRCEVNVIFIDD